MNEFGKLDRTMGSDDEDGKDERFEREEGELPGLKWVCLLLVLGVVAGVIYLIMNPLGNKFKTVYATTIGTEGTTTKKYSYG